MLKVTLDYTDCLEDQRKFFKILAFHKVKIIKTRRLFTIRPKVIIHIDDYDKLSKLLFDLNKSCWDGVTVVKARTINKLDNKIRIPINTKRKSG